MTGPAGAEGGGPGAGHEALVDRLVRAGIIRTPAVEAAFRAVPRAVFLAGTGAAPDEDRVTILVDGAGRSTSALSQPSLVASMLEQLGVERGQRVLEVGTGIGYTAALLARVVGPEGTVVSVELDAALAARARARLARAGVGTVEVVAGDGGYGVPSRAPWDRILLTAGAWDLPPPLLEQLAPTGRLVAPLSLRGAWCAVAFEPRAGHLASVGAFGCHVTTRLRGAFAGPGRRHALGPGPDAWLDLDDGRPVDGAALWARLTGPARAAPTDVWATGHEVLDGLLLWLALHEGDFGVLETAREDLVPAVVRLPGKLPLTGGALGRDALALLTRAGGAGVGPEATRTPFPVGVRAWGPATDLAERTVAHVEAWLRAGRPAARTLRVRVVPAGHGRAAPGEQVLRRRWTDVVVGWAR